jgi:hypothetical protein
VASPVSEVTPEEDRESGSVAERDAPDATSAPQDEGITFLYKNGTRVSYFSHADVSVPLAEQAETVAVIPDSEISAPEETSAPADATEVTEEVATGVDVDEPALEVDEEATTASIIGEFAKTATDENSEAKLEGANDNLTSNAEERDVALNDAAGMEGRFAETGAPDVEEVELENQEAPTEAMIEEVSASIEADAAVPDVIAEGDHAALSPVSTEGANLEVAHAEAELGPDAAPSEDGIYIHYMGDQTLLTCKLIASYQSPVDTTRLDAPPIADSLEGETSELNVPSPEPTLEPSKDPLKDVEVPVPQSLQAADRSTPVLHVDGATIDGAGDQPANDDLASTPVASKEPEPFASDVAQAESEPSTLSLVQPIDSTPSEAETSPSQLPEVDNEGSAPKTEVANGLPHDTAQDERVPTEIVEYSFKQQNPSVSEASDAATAEEATKEESQLPAEERVPTTAEPQFDDATPIEAPAATIESPNSEAPAELDLNAGDHATSMGGRSDADTVEVSASLAEEQPSAALDDTFVSSPVIEKVEEQEPIPSTLKEESVIGAKLDHEEAGEWYIHLRCLLCSNVDTQNPVRFKTTTLLQPRN